MKNNKPRLGRSIMSALSSAYIIVFGILWTVITVAFHTPFFFTLVGIMIVLLPFTPLLRRAMHTIKNRFSSFFIRKQKE